MVLCGPGCQPRSNVVLLAAVFVMFGGFAAAEVVAAFAAHSLSLLGDAASMVVDAFTYVLNMAAERRKGLGIDERTRLKLELFIPLASMAALLATSAYVVKEAVDTIASPPDEPEAGDLTMLVFASVNLGIDFVSLFCFARVNRLFGYESLDADAARDFDGYEALGEDAEAGQAAAPAPSEGGDAPEPWDGHQHKSNTNMCSAYTHVIADTLRSLAVMTAAIISRASSRVNPDLADAWAAIAVSAIIFFSMLPLLSGLRQKFFQLYAC